MALYLNYLRADPQAASILNWRPPSLFLLRLRPPNLSPPGVSFRSPLAAASGRWKRNGTTSGGLLPVRSPSAGRSARRRTGSAKLAGRRPVRPSRRRLSGWLNRNRRLVAALLLCIAAGLTVQQLTPAPADTVIAFAAAGDLPAGKTLEPGDVSGISVPPGLVPSGSPVSASAFEGKQLATPLRRGQLLTDAQILGPGLLAGSPAGTAAVPLRMSDPASIQLVSPGQLVNVVLTGGNDFKQTAQSQVLAEAVPVLWTSVQGGKAGPWLATADSDGLIVVAAGADQARRLAGASTQGKLFFVLVAAAPG
ncbi:Flp pilus assembly protein CpaB [Arthrobacter oryzae]|uniref:Flp pilus assembly protein CpaB n=1 Tax=Arthrobacter oryzae TaxID=409290 RepID=A0A495EU31_9MICC|nr:Flp pilus assembly protein CpaB [Arthrobacter oryzae]